MKKNKDQLKHVNVPKAKSKIGRALYPFTLIGLAFLTLYIWVKNGFKQENIISN